ncbi:MAG: GDP-mannose 4,6-dehydratase [Chitinispirillaceae bacterium]
MKSEKYALVTGANGFVGRHLSSYLKRHGYMVHGTDRDPSCCSEHTDDYFPADIRNTAALSDLMSRFSYDLVFHLAAVSSVLRADSSPRQTMEVNLLGTISLLDAAVEAESRAKLLLVGSSKQYAGNQENPVGENSELKPTSFYGISKLASELSAQNYLQRGLDLYFTRSFNHTGPGQSPDFVCSDWARQVALIEKGRSEPVLKVGNLNESLDFSDVRDVVSAYFLILEHGRSSGVYNVCSGEVVPLSFIINYLISKTSRHIRIESCSERLRSQNRSPVRRGNNSKLIEETGWKREYGIEETLDDLYRYWLERV